MLVMNFSTARFGNHWAVLVRRHDGDHGEGDTIDMYEVVGDTLSGTIDLIHGILIHGSSHRRVSDINHAELIMLLVSWATRDSSLLKFMVGHVRYLLDCNQDDVLNALNKVPRPLDKLAEVLSNGS